MAERGSGVDVQDQTSDVPACHGHRGQVAVDLGALGAGDLTRLGPSSSRIVQHRSSSCDNSRHAFGSDATDPEQAGLVAQYRRIGDGFAAVSEHRRHIDRNP
ncbi:hypothetical protein BSA16_33990 [Micromonospora sp. Rc5]|nr:hypothetical protein BSA16_33990 [Micromonospora sp. Rc5]